jgi:DNA-binding PadR family transcriptional regulator
MRVTGALLKVLRAFLERPATESYGLELSRMTGLKSGTLYPILDRLEKIRWVESRWEDIDPVAHGRPRRRFYRLTAQGVREAQSILIDYGATGGLAWAL